jgi:hypothetical protein
LPARDGDQSNPRQQSGRDYYLRQRRAGKGHKEAMRCVKRRLSDIVYRQLVHDETDQATTRPGGHQGATLSSSAADSTLHADSSDQSLPDPATGHLTT